VRLINENGEYTFQMYSRWPFGINQIILLLVIIIIMQKLILYTITLYKKKCETSPKVDILSTSASQILKGRKGTVIVNFRDHAPLMFLRMDSDV
jgi:hypothetical protein